MKARPTLVFDGDCGFCRLWIARWHYATGERVDYAPYQSEAVRHPEISREKFGEAVHLFEAGRTSRGAEAVLRALSYAPRMGWLPRIYNLPLMPFVLERGYRFIASRRPLAARATKLFWGSSTLPAPISFTTRLVSAGVGLCYLLAFVSLGTQVQGLIGSDGIMPSAALLSAAKLQLGPARYWLFPTVAWINASNAALTSYCVLGGLASLGLIFGVFAGPCALICWALYLSLCSIGADFMSFQWDVLLLEAGLITCVLAPWSRSPKHSAAPSRGALWLMRLLLIKLMLQSGLVKLYSGDPSWRDLTALTYHYWTQPLPTPLAWYAHHLPLWAHKVSCFILFVIELGAPILIIFPRKARAAGAAAIAALMLLIALTGNYGFFNVLTVVLCLSCLDDHFFSNHGEQPPPKIAAPKARTWSIGVLAALSLTIGLFQTLSIVGVPPPPPVRALIGALSPLRSFNSYGLFAVMTRSRDEIVLEVSSDGRDWLEYPFRFKPSAVAVRPTIIAPFMPRVDWQCWFASLGAPSDSPWFGNLMFRLLDRSPSVAALLGPSPLVASVPLYARAVRYETTFSPRGSSAWWSRTRKGLFFPVVSLKR